MEERYYALKFERSSLRLSLRSGTYRDPILHPYLYLDTPSVKAAVAETVVVAWIHDGS